MFARSRYNWAATQVETCLKFDFGVTDLILKASKMVLEDDAFFRDVKKAKDASDINWYAATAFVAGQTLADVHNEDHANVPLPLSVGLIHVSAAAMVMTKGFGVPQAQEWIEEQYETFGLLDDGSGNPDGADSGDVEEESPYLDAVAVAAEMFDWDEDEVDRISDEVSEWGIRAAEEIAEAFGISDDIDHTPWELNPMFQAGMHIARVNVIQDLKEEISDELDKGGDSLQDLSVIHIMLLEGVEAKSASRYQELVEAVFKVCGWDWDERAKGNAHFFAKNFDKAGMSVEDIRDAIISLIRKMQAE